MLLGTTDKIIVQYYRIKNNLHIYYNHKLLSGFEKFIFKDFNEMIQKILPPSNAWKEVNEFRQAHGYTYLPLSKYRLVEYNEAVFHKAIRIKPIALFGYKKETRRIARKLGLLYFPSAKKFYAQFDKR
ncbi:hypothetical protein A3K73_06465 [Candidatus Pacearchaeota archaeon RBG_13_36_9]|nr:MAG: hypothetical protein A3K73_06465 [Candidatus Pacearchaeota archaeon RBG_13_36_9]